MSSITSHLPVALTRALRQMRDSRRLAGARRDRAATRDQLVALLRELRARRQSDPTDAELQRLATLWNNSAASGQDYVREVVRQARKAEAPILELGSGLTTLVLAVYADVPVTTLENIAAWHDQVGEVLADAGLPADGYHLAPLVKHQTFWWYDLKGVPLAETYGLVVADGPPCRDRPGGRVGLMPLLSHRLPSGTRILIDRHMQNAEAAAVHVWTSQYGLQVESTKTDVQVLVRS